MLECYCGRTLSLTLVTFINTFQASPLLFTNNCCTAAEQEFYESRWRQHTKQTKDVLCNSYTTHCTVTHPSIPPLINPAGICDIPTHWNIQCVHKQRVGFLPKVNSALDQTGASYSQDSAHRVRKMVKEGHNSRLLTVESDGVFICNLEKGSVSVFSQIIPKHKQSIHLKLLKSDTDKHRCWTPKEMRSQP